jgi:hypothetical protein
MGGRGRRNLDLGRWEEERRAGVGLGWVGEGMGWLKCALLKKNATWLLGLVSRSLFQSPLIITVVTIYDSHKVSTEFCLDRSAHEFRFRCLANQTLPQRNNRKIHAKQPATVRSIMLRFIRCSGCVFASGSGLL